MMPKTIMTKSYYEGLLWERQQYIDRGEHEKYIAENRGCGMTFHQIINMNYGKKVMIRVKKNRA